MAETLSVQLRETCGKRRNKRLRTQGRIPAVLYGHGEACVSLSIATSDLETAMRRGAKLLELKGDVNETALLRHVQWDTFAVDVLHVDFIRVSVGEHVDTTVAIELRGEAAGAKAGGIVEQVLHEVEIECPVTAIPEKITVRVTNLDVGQSILAKDLELPEGAKLLSNPETLVVHCVEAKVEEEEAAPAVAEGAEPEVIGRKPAEEDEGEAAEE
jgi:large subunit ribosomal protein L25